MKTDVVEELKKLAEECRGSCGDEVINANITNAFLTAFKNNSKLFKNVVSSIRKLKGPSSFTAVNFEVIAVVVRSIYESDEVQHYIADYHKEAMNPGQISVAEWRIFRVVFKYVTKNIFHK